MKAFRKKLIHLHHCRGLRGKGMIKLLQHDAKLKRLYELSSQDLRSISQISLQQATLLLHDLRNISIEPLLQSYEKMNIQIMTIFDDAYPLLLKETYEPPLVLFLKGNASLLQKSAIAVVGARAASSYAHKAVHLLIPTLVEKGLVIVSGLAKGVDTMAHLEAMESGGHTIAVLGSGFWHPYPKENEYLLDKIANEHLVLTEYPPFIRPQKWHFPMRNRIISGLTNGTLIVQAKRRSGSFITAEYALQTGREVFAVPGNITDPLSEGTNLLIQQGAKLVQNGKDILEEFSSHIIK